MNTTQWGGVAVGGMPNSTTPPAMITAQQVRDSGLLAPTPPGTPIAGSIDKKLDDAATSLSDILARIGAFLGTAPNTIYGWLRAIMRKDVAVPTDIGGTYDTATDSLEAQQESGGGGLTAQQVRDSMKLAPSESPDPATGSIDDLLTAHVPAVTLPAQILGGQLYIYRGDTWESPIITGLGDLTGWTKISFTLKQSLDDLDTASIVDIVLSNPGVVGDGLQYINKAPATTKANGSIVVLDELLGSARVQLKAPEAAKLAVAPNLFYDVQVHFPTKIETRGYGKLMVLGDVKRATS